MSSSTYSDIVELIRRIQTVGFCLDLDISVQPTRDQLSPLFRHLHSLFLSHILPRHRPPPPPLAADGRVLDLFRLFCSVRDRGFHAWPAVASDSDLPPHAAPVVKLLHHKHLSSFDRWIREVLRKKSEKTRLSDAKNRLLTPTKAKKEEPVETEIPLLTAKKEEKENREEGLRKRKWGELVGMLNWVRKVATRPGHPSIGVKVAGKDERMVEAAEQFEQALVLRNVVFCECSGHEWTPAQKRQKPDPSIYEDHSTSENNGNRRTRSSQTALGNQSHGNLEKDPLAFSGLRSCTSGESSKNPLLSWDPADDVDDIPQARAVLPPYVGCFNDDDLKWLGTRIWPLGEGEKPLIDQKTICEGREDNCKCERRGSVECVRFHIAEKRLQLKRGLGSAFYHWKFNKMGEEVSLSWKEEEEENFKAVVRQSSQSPDRGFWQQLFLTFPSKSRQSLVNYYFNVFLVRRRSYQNRVTPTNIDSDDDESEFGFTSNPLGHNATKVPDPKHVLCPQNSQCIDLDEFEGIDFQMILDDIEWQL